MLNLNPLNPNPERERLLTSMNDKSPWKFWGPYLSERQWGTVREDYSDHEEAWEAFSYEQALSRAYRWGEDGIAGISDNEQKLCFSVAFWNGADPFIKERLFGLTNRQGNHGEDVKEYYYYLDNTPTHSYMHYLYKYPQEPFPYETLVQANAGRGMNDREFELIDTGIFDQDAYFDIDIRYAKAGGFDILVEIEVHNRASKAAPIHVLPTIWFRNTWTGIDTSPYKGQLESVEVDGVDTIRADHNELGPYTLYSESKAEPLFVENETNYARLFHLPNQTRYPKDGINRYIVNKEIEAVNPQKKGTKAAFYINEVVPAHSSKTFRLRLSKENKGNAFGEAFKKTFKMRKKEADLFYKHIIPKSLPEDDQSIMRQAFAGLLWTKQFYNYDVESWLKEKDCVYPQTRNVDWKHMKNADIISMPDKWEYPWYAVWDLAFHTASLVLVDPEFAKKQLLLFLDDRYMHTNGQLPAYEWNFNDVNPPVHAWAVRAVYRLDRNIGDKKEDLEFLKTAFEKLKGNFEWWSHLKSKEGIEVYQGGFLGMDNIGVFDRSEKLPTGGYLEQSDGTAWMALYAQNMIQITTELAAHDTAYEDEVLYYLEQFLKIAGSMDRVGDHQDEMWDPEDQFFYDVLRFPDGHATRIKIRSMVGLLPLCAAIVIEKSTLDKLPRLKARFNDLVEQHEKLTRNIACPSTPGVNGRRLLAILDEDKLRNVLHKMLDESEFLSPFGIRSLSKYHEENPYQFEWEGEVHTVAYLPGESDSAMFGGNSNWRGPVWFPTNVLIIRSLINLFSYYGNEFTIEYPTGSGNILNLYEIAEEISGRLLSIFLPDENGRRPLYGHHGKFQNDPHWNQYILFYEYFQAETGEGLGASHQTGWTANLAMLMATFEAIHPKAVLKGGLDQAVMSKKKRGF
jgi:hypothetical protein